MLDEFITRDETKFIYSHGEIGYKEVLEDFPNSKKITIVTYNISKTKNDLIGALKKVRNDCKIDVFTNIPNRWDTYYGDARAKATATINIYMTKLKPEAIGSNTKVFFDFFNHGKIIMTDTKVYVGSENFSEESAENTEFGFISYDKGLIDFIRNKVVSRLMKESVPYYKYDYTRLAVEASVLLSAINYAKNQFHEETYRYEEDIDHYGERYIWNEALLTEKTLDYIRGVVEDVSGKAYSMWEALFDIHDEDEDRTDPAYDTAEKIERLASIIEGLTYDNDIYDLAQYDSVEYINELLQTEYSAEAYEENLEYCISLASEQATSRTLDLTTAAEEKIDKLYAQMEELQNLFVTLLDELKKNKLKVINPEIDNT